MKIYPITTACSSQPLSLTIAWDSAASITGGWIMRVSGEAGGCGWWGAASRRMPLLKGTCRWGESDGLGVWERDGENLLLSLRGSQCSASSHPHLWDRMRKIESEKVLCSKILDRQMPSSIPREKQYINQTQLGCLSSLSYALLKLCYHGVRMVLLLGKMHSQPGQHA